MGGGGALIKVVPNFSDDLFGHAKHLWLSKTISLWYFSEKALIAHILVDLNHHIDEFGFWCNSN